MMVASETCRNAGATRGGVFALARSRVTAAMPVRTSELLRYRRAKPESEGVRVTSIRIELLNESHRAAVRALASDETLSHTAAPTPARDADIDQLLAHNAAGPRVVRTFAILDGALVVGTVTLKRLDAGDNSAELSYWVGTEYHRKGYAFGGAQLAVAYAFDELLVDYMHAHFLKVSNVGSLRVLQKLGFTKDPNKEDMKSEGRFAARFPDDYWTFVRLNRPADIAGAAKGYARRWDAYMTQYCGGRASCFELAEELMRQRLQGESLRVLDIGCGTGAFTARQLGIDGPQRHVTAIDGSATSLLIARHVIGTDPRVSFVQADITTDDWAAKLPPGSIDAAFIGWVTHEVPPGSLPRLYGNLARVLRPGGVLFNVDFMDALEPGFRGLADEYRRHRVTDEFRTYRARFESLPPIAAAKASELPARTTPSIYHAAATHVRHLHQAGFVEAEAIWRYIGFSMVMAVR